MSHFITIFLNLYIPVAWELKTKDISEQSSISATKLFSDTFFHIKLEFSYLRTIEPVNFFLKPVNFFSKEREDKKWNFMLKKSQS